MTSMSSHLQGILDNPVSQAERTRRRVSRLETRLGKDAGVSDAQGIVEFDPNGIQNANEGYALDAPNPIYIRPLFSDFMKTNEDFLFESIGVGSFARTPDDTVGHYGIIKVTQSGANTGALARPGTTSIANVKIWNGFIFECVFYVPTAATANTVVQIGFMDSLTSSLSTDGIFFSWAQGVNPNLLVYAAGVQEASSSITTANSFDTWYKARIEVAPGGEATGSITNRAGEGAQTAIIDASDAIGLTAVPMIKAYKTTAGSVDLAYFDYAACWSPFPVRW